MACGSYNCEVRCYQCDCQWACESNHEPFGTVLECQEACPACAIVPAPQFVSEFFSGSQFVIPSCEAYEVSFTNAVQDCNNAMNASIAADCDATLATCQAGCTDSACLEDCSADYYGCLPAYRLVECTCEKNAFDGDSSDMQDCAEQTLDGGDRVDTCCGDEADSDPEHVPLFPKCLRTADKAYYDAMWPDVGNYFNDLVDYRCTEETTKDGCESTYHATISVCAATESSCSTGCAGDPVCLAGCLAVFITCSTDADVTRQECLEDARCARRTSELARRATFYTSEENRALARNSVRASCISQRLQNDEVGEGGRPRAASCNGNYIGQLKTRDLSFEAHRFSLYADAATCEAGCPCNGFDDQTSEFTTCRGNCNLTLAINLLSLDRERMESRRDLCVERYLPDAVNELGYGRCLSWCDITDATCTTNCQEGRLMCDTTCCTAVDPGACGDFCSDTFDCCIGGGVGSCGDWGSGPNCSADLGTCLDGCVTGVGEQDGQCAEDCGEAFFDCFVGPMRDVSKQPVMNQCGGSGCAGLCRNKLYNDCPQCDLDQYGPSNFLMCLPDQFNMHYVQPEVQETLCD